MIPFKASLFLLERNFQNVKIEKVKANPTTCHERREV